MPDARCWYSATADPARPFSVAGLAVDERMPPMHVNRPAGLPHYLFIHFLDPVEVGLADGLRVRRRHTLVIWPPGPAHYFGDDRRSWRHTWMYGLGTRVAGMLAASGLPLQTPLALEDASITDRYFMRLYDELHRHLRPDDVIVESLLQAWLREMARATESRTLGREIPARLLVVREAFDRDPAAAYQLPDLAAMAGLSVSQFSALFRAHFGTSPVRYLIDLRLRRALHHLSDVNLNVAEIGRKVGFEDPFYFSKQFRRRFGVSPLAYRKGLQRRARQADGGGTGARPRRRGGAT